MSPMTVNTVANSTPPKRPWMPRKRTSSTIFWEIPQRADAPTNPAMPASRNGLRPNMSPSLPATGTTVVEVSR